MNPDQPRTSQEERLTADMFSGPVIDASKVEWGALAAADREIRRSRRDFYWSALVEQRSRKLARDRDAFARRLLEDRVPRLLHWTLDRPRALRALLRVVPRWRPTMSFVDRRHAGPMGALAAQAAAGLWAQEVGIDDGLIFTYTDPDGLPAEVYGP